MASVTPGQAGLDTPVEFDIPAGDLARTLITISRQGGVMISFPPDIVAGRRAGALQGRIPVRDALARVLGGTGLRMVAGSGGGVTVVADPGTTATAKPGLGDIAAIDVTDEGVASRFGDVGFQAGDAGDSLRLGGVSAREVPLAISTVTSKVLQSQGVTTPTDAIKNVSGAVVGSSNGGVDNFTIRGFQTSNITVNGQGINGVNNSVNVQPPIDSIERVDVLKGATSILTGTSANGGTVNVVTKQPTNQAIRDVIARYGNFNYRTLAVDLGGPVADTESLTYRFVASGNQADQNFAGYRDPHEHLLAPTLRWDNGDAMIQAGIRYSSQRRGASQYTFIPLDMGGDPRPLRIRRGFPLVNPNIGFLTETLDVTSDQTYRFGDILGVDVTANNRLLCRNVFSENNNFTWDAGGKSSSRDGRYSVRQNFSIGSYDLVTNQSDLTFTYDAGFAKQTSKIGLDYRGFDYNVRTAKGEPSLINPLTGSPQSDLFRVPFSSFRNEDFQIGKADTIGAYYLEKFDTLDNRLHILGTVRYERNRQIGSSTLIPVPKDFIPQSASGLTYETGAVFDVTPYLNVYGRSFSGFVPNYVPEVSTGKTPPPEERTGMDVGTNLTLLDKKLNLKAAYFDLSQTNFTVCSPETCSKVLLIGGKRSQGFEFDVQGELVPGLNIIGSFSSTVAKFQNNGHKPIASGIPQYTASLWATYTFQRGLFEGMTLGAGAAGVSRSFTSTVASPSNGTAVPLKVPGYVTIDALIGYDIDRWSLQLNVKNILDHYYYSPAYLSNLVGIGQGRTFLVSAKYSFE